MTLERTLPALRTVTLDWRRIIIAAVVAVVVVMLPHNISATIDWITEGQWADWWTLKQAGGDAGTAALYGTEYGYRWSPLVAYALAWLPNVEWWVALHVIAALFLRPWWVVPVVLLSFPFGEDARVGNVIIFIVVAALYALRGNRLATFAFLAFALLMPRPLMAPLTVWLLWKRPEWRWPFAAMFAVHLGLVGWTGLGDEWLRRLVESGDEIGHFMNYGPSRWLGMAWVPIGLLLGAWLTWKGRLGLASLAVQPYLFPYYYLFLILELNPPLPAHQGIRSPARRTAPPASPRPIRSS